MVPNPVRLKPATLSLAFIFLVPRASSAQVRVEDLSQPASARAPVRVRSAGVALNVVIEQRAVRGRDGVRVIAAGRCVTPCTLYLAPGMLRLRANGPGVRSTDEDIDFVGGPSTLTVRAGRAALHNVGIGLVAAGATTLLATMLVAIADQGVFAGTTRGSIGLESSAVIGASAAGAALLAAGIPLMLLHRNGMSLSADAPRAGLSLSRDHVGVAIRARF